jgi:hypothetical protein
MVVSGEEVGRLVEHGGEVGRIKICWVKSAGEKYK